MSREPKDDGVFPHSEGWADDEENTGGTIIHRGLTKRELFASMAMQSLIQKGQLDDCVDAAGGARLACGYADALIAELAKEPKL